jgi:hypothetical protein
LRARRGASTAWTASDVVQRCVVEIEGAQIAEDVTPRADLIHRTSAALDQLAIAHGKRGSL